MFAVSGSRRNDPDFLASKCSHNDKDSSVQCFADLHKAILAIAQSVSKVKRAIGDNFLCFVRLYVVLCNVSDVCIVPIEIHRAGSYKRMFDRN